LSKQVRKKTRRYSGSVGESRLMPYFFVGAATIYLILFTSIPLLRGFWFSFTDSLLLAPTEGNFIGFENYRRYLTDSSFYSSLWTTIVYTFVVVVGAVSLGVISAIAINEKLPGRAIFRSMLTVPWAVPGVSVVLIYNWIYNYDSGVANQAVQALGMGQKGWLIDPSLGMFAVTFASIWKVFPFIMLVVLAALQSVPEELREASKVDGADRFSAFKTVVIPHLMPTIRVASLLMTIWSIRRFEIIYLLTGGGPSGATNTIVINVYKQAFESSELGRAAALGILGLLLSLSVTIVYFAVDRKNAKRDSL
jgi:multiple sugar transport system permease protein